MTANKALVTEVSQRCFDWQSPADMTAHSPTDFSDLLGDDAMALAPQARGPYKKRAT